MSSLIRIPLFFAAFVLLGLTFGYITFSVLSYSRTVEVPSLTNLTLVEANEALSNKGLYLQIEGEDFDPLVQAGKILRQDVPAGNKVKERRSIKVVISKGPRVQSVPLVTGETIGDAEAVLVQKGIRIGRIIRVHSDSVEQGKIVAQQPESDERLTDTVTVLVSLGPHELTYFCPDFLDKGLDEAKDIAQKIGVVLETKGTGTVIKAQKPRAGTPVKSGEKIYLELKEENSND